MTLNGFHGESWVLSSYFCHFLFIKIANNKAMIKKSKESGFSDDKINRKNSKRSDKGSIDGLQTSNSQHWNDFFKVR